jgi:NTE family protein
MMSQFTNLVFEGGGVKGIGYVGALKVLEERGILEGISRIGGTSAGAINAVLLGCDFTNAEQLAKLREMKFEKFLDDSWGAARDTRRLMTEYGWYKGDYFREWIGDLIAEKLGSPDVTFAEFKEATGKEIYLIGSNLSTGYGEVFSPEHTPGERVADAVRISMSIPLLFASIKNARGDVYVDGGLLRNYPVKLFDRMKYIAEGDQAAAARSTKYYDDENEKFLTGVMKQRAPYVYNRQTLGFRLDSGAEIAALRYGNIRQVNQIDSIVDYAKALFMTALAAQENAHLHSDDWHRTVYIDAKGVSSINFDLTKADQNKLLKSGEISTRTYFDWFDKLDPDDMPVNSIAGPGV